MGKRLAFAKRLGKDHALAERELASPKVGARVPRRAN
jgi:hypothetical protein